MFAQVIFSHSTFSFSHRTHNQVYCWDLKKWSFACPAKSPLRVQTMFSYLHSWIQKEINERLKYPVASPSFQTPNSRWLRRIHLSSLQLSLSLNLRRTQPDGTGALAVHSVTSTCCCWSHSSGPFSSFSMRAHLMPQANPPPRFPLNSKSDPAEWSTAGRLIWPRVTSGSLSGDIVIEWKKKKTKGRKGEQHSRCSVSPYRGPLRRNTGLWAASW